MISSIGFPVTPERYFNGPNSEASSAFELTSTIRVSSVMIVSLRDWIFCVSFSSFPIAVSSCRSKAFLLAEEE